MKKIIQIAILIGAIYFVYAYYQKNYTVAGKKKQLDKQKDLEATYKSKADELRIAFTGKGHRDCEAMELPSFFSQDNIIQVQWACKLKIEAEAKTIDWLSEAMSGT